jgi:transposase
MQLETITKLLNIPNQKVTSIVQSTEDHFEFVLEPIEDGGPVCSGCGRIHNSYAHSHSYVVIEDLPISGKRVFLHVRKRKVFCSEDGRIRVWELFPSLIRDL